VVVLGLFFISCIAGYLPVFSCVLALKLLIINGIHFCWWCVLLGVILTMGSYFFFLFQKEKVAKRKGNFLSIAPLTKK
jgi:hypothetical protein